MLKVRMLGQEEISYDGQPILSGKNKITKTLELLLLLLHCGEEGITRSALQGALYGTDEVSDAGNSLRVTSHRLRKILLEAGFPEEEYISSKEGIYRFCSTVEMDIDIWKFRELLEKAEKEKQEEKKAALLTEACDLYRGEFLPKLSGEEWVILAAASYKKAYETALEWLIEYLKKRDNYEEILRLVALPCQLYPFEEWQTVRIDCYIAENRYKKAMEEYERTANLLSEELGVGPSEHMLEQFQRMSSHISNRYGAIEEIKKDMIEGEKQEGAFYCTPPSFRDVYRMVRRNMERSGQSVYMLVCSLTDGKGFALEQGDKLEELAERLKNSIQVSLRRGDAYTRYGANQYLVMLGGISRENCHVVIDRITASFTKEHKSWAKKLQCSVTSLYDEEG